MLREELVCQTRTLVYKRVNVLLRLNSCIVNGKNDVLALVASWHVGIGKRVCMDAPLQGRQRQLLYLQDTLGNTTFTRNFRLTFFHIRNAAQRCSAFYLKNQNMVDVFSVLSIAFAGHLFEYKPSTLNNIHRGRYIFLSVGWN